MIIKKFQARTEQEAILLAKDELGKDAVVMNIKTVNPRGVYRLFKKPLVEITAAVDENILNKDENPEEKSIVELPKPEPEVKLKEVNPDIIMEDEVAEPEEESAIEKKLNNLQVLLEQQMNGRTAEKTETSRPEEEKTEESKTAACVRLIYNQLVKNEVDEKYAGQIIGEIERSLEKEASVDNILSSIYQKIILKLGQPKIIRQIEEEQPKYVFFIGPTGVGKTTTIAKIASTLALQEKARVALVAADTYRIAAVEQLKTYANILSVPLKVLYNPEEMKQICGELDEFDVVLVDTAGRSHQNQQQQEDLEKLICSVPKEEREVYLVLSATTKYKDLACIAEKYSEITPYNLIFTKLDETESIGNILNIRMLTGARLSYETWGQDVPDDIGKINPQSIAKRLLGGND